MGDAKSCLILDTTSSTHTHYPTPTPDPPFWHDPQPQAPKIPAGVQNGYYLVALSLVTESDAPHGWLGGLGPPGHDPLEWVGELVHLGLLLLSFLPN